MDYLVVDGVKPWDGRYEFDIVDAELTTREWGWIKRCSGYMPLTVAEGFDGGDPELFACFAVIMLRRAGKIQAAEVEDVFDRIADAPFGATIRVESDSADQTDDQSPPPSSWNGSTASSGEDSATSSASSDDPLNATGMPVSAISEWPRLRSESSPPCTKRAKPRWLA
jgi:hypothetical protein